MVLTGSLFSVYVCLCHSRLNYSPNQLATHLQIEVTVIERKWLQTLKHQQEERL